MCLCNTKSAPSGIRGIFSLIFCVYTCNADLNVYLYVTFTYELVSRWDAWPLMFWFLWWQGTQDGTAQWRPRSTERGALSEEHLPSSLMLSLSQLIGPRNITTARMTLPDAWRKANHYIGPSMSAHPCRCHRFCFRALNVTCSNLLNKRLD